MEDGGGIVRSPAVVGFLDGEGVAVSSFCDSGVGAFASFCGDAFEDFGDGVRSCPVQCVGGENPAWLVTWRRTMFRVRMNESRSGSISAVSAASVMSARMA